MLVVALAASVFVVAFGGAAGSPGPGLPFATGSPNSPSPLPPTAVLPLLPLVLTPSSGAVGSTIAATGTGFSTNSTILFTFNATVVNSTCAADSSGNFPGETPTPCTFKVPADPIGAYNVVASDARGFVAGSVPAVGAGPTGVAYDSGTGELFVANHDSDSVSVIDDTSDHVVTTVPVGTNPSGVAYDSELGEVFVANYNGGAAGTVSVISDTSDAVVATVSVGPGPVGIAYDPGTHELFVADSGGGTGDTVSVVSDATNSVVASVLVGLGPAGVAYDPATGEAFVANGASTSNSVSVIDGATNSVVRTVTVGGGPSSVAYDSAMGEVFVADDLSNTVSVISGSTYSVAATVPVGDEPSSVAYDPAKGEIFVTNGGGGHGSNVSVISDATNSIVQWLAVGTAPSGVAYDSGMHEAFVANSGSDNVTVISTGMQGIAIYTVTATPPRSYAVTFTETGLPSNTSWSVMVSSGAVGTLTRYSSTASIGFELANGSYAYTIEPVTAYAPGQLGSTFTVDGSGLTISVGFLPGYAVTFTESGLAVPPVPTSTLAWTLTVSGATFDVTGAAVTVQLPNGTFSFAVTGPPGYAPVSVAGVLAVNGAPLSVSVPMTPNDAAYAVTFAENGLPAGTRWSVTVDGFTVVATGSTLVLTLGNGTVSYTVGAPSGYTAAPSNGSLTVLGSSMNEPVSFSGPNSPTSPSSLPWTWIIIGIVIGLVVVGIAVAWLRRRRPPASRVEGSPPSASGGYDAAPERTFPPN
ncbi:MAG: YncE family protein [Thermoplasmata archaeon]